MSVNVVVQHVAKRCCDIWSARLLVLVLNFKCQREGGFRHISKFQNQIFPLIRAPVPCLCSARTSLDEAKVWPNRTPPPTVTTPWLGSQNFAHRHWLIDSGCCIDPSLACDYRSRLGMDRCTLDYCNYCLCVPYPRANRSIGHFPWYRTPPQWYRSLYLPLNLPLSIDRSTVPLFRSIDFPVDRTLPPF